jgi:DNA-directed RNA polymerase subunit K/omega
MLEQLEAQFTKYEIARIVGARALQIAMDAPLLLKIEEKELEEINYNPIEIAKRELVSGVLPITINRPLPKKKETKLKKLTAEEVEELRKKEEEHKKEMALQEEVKAKRAEAEEAKAKAKTKSKPTEKIEDETKVKVDGEETEVIEPVEEKTDEIMELATPEDEVEESSSSGSEDEGI